MVVATRERENGNCKESIIMVVVALAAVVVRERGSFLNV